MVNEKKMQRENFLPVFIPVFYNLCKYCFWKCCCISRKERL